MVGLLSRECYDLLRRNTVLRWCLLVREGLYLSGRDQASDGAGRIREYNKYSMYGKRRGEKSCSGNRAIGL